MPLSDALKKFRDTGYPKKESGSDKGSEPEGVRVIKMTDDEAKPLAQVPDGQEVQCDVRARKDGNKLHVLSVAYTGGGQGTMPDQEMNDMAAHVAGMPMRQQTEPSPS